MNTPSLPQTPSRKASAQKLYRDRLKQDGFTTTTVIVPIERVESVRAYCAEVVALYRARQNQKGGK